MGRFERYTSIGSALKSATLAYQSNTALIETNRESELRRLTFRELRSEASQFASGLRSLGFCPGDHCAILAANQSRWLTSAFGVFWAGGVLVPLDYKLQAQEQVSLLRHSQAKLIITDSNLFTQLRKEPAFHELNIDVILLDKNEEETYAYSDLLKEPQPLVERKSDDLASIVYSSGTGGSPKGCMLSHKAYLSQADSLAELYPILETDRVFSVLPTNHAIDFMCGFLLPILLGASVVHQRTLRPNYILSTMKDYQITHMAVVPLMLELFEERIQSALDKLPTWQKTIVDSLINVNHTLTLKRPNTQISKLLLKPIHDAFGGHLKVLFCGGAFVPPARAEFFYRLGLPVAIGYGLTEASTVVTLNDLAPFRPDTVGLPVPNVQLRIANPNQNGVGEVLVSSPTLMSGYLNDTEQTHASIVDGWLHTGDLGLIDASGHLQLLGRKKNMIVTDGGKNIYPEDIETNFSNWSQVAEFCVFANAYLSDNPTIEQDHLVMVARAQSEIDLDAAKKEFNQLNRSLAAHKRITELKWVDYDFPRTASLKIKRRQLAELIRRRDEHGN